MVRGEHVYLAIDLKSFYASVECHDRGLDPLRTHLVVADEERTDKTICLAVSPSLKAYGIPGRARLFEVRQRLASVNAERTMLAPGGRLSGESCDSRDLEHSPRLKASMVIAKPRMAHYLEVSGRVYGVYLRYAAPEHIHVYSIDEVFIDATPYLRALGMGPHEMASAIVRDILAQTGITATAGIGTNMYLAKVAMDIVAKHMPADEDGVRVAELDEMSYRRLLWNHRPLTDFWRVGHGYSSKLEKLGLYTMGDVARASLNPQEEAKLYKAFGINAELLIDHAWGWEPTTIEYIKAYRPSTNSLSSGQVLKEPYDFDKGRLIVREMTELLVLDLVKKKLVTKQMVLTIGYDRESLKVMASGKTMKDTVYAVAKTGKAYAGKVSADSYGRPHPSHAHGTENLKKYTSSTRKIMDTVMELYTKVVDPDLLIRRVNIAACGLISESAVPAEEPEQLSLFVDYDTMQRERAEEAAADERERKLQQATLYLQSRYGKNAVLKGMNLQEGATTIERNGQVGGHKAE